MSFKHIPDGNSTHRPNGNYMEWRVFSEAGDLLCAFYGGMALTAACFFCDNLNQDNFIQPGTDGWMERALEKRCSSMIQTFTGTVESFENGYYRIHSPDAPQHCQVMFLRPHEVVPALQKVGAVGTMIYRTTSRGGERVRAGRSGLWHLTESDAT